MNEKERDRIRIETREKTIADIWKGVVVRKITDQEVQAFMKKYSATTRQDKVEYHQKHGEYFNG